MDATVERESDSRFQPQGMPKGNFSRGRGIYEYPNRLIYTPAGERFPFLFIPLVYYEMELRVTFIALFVLCVGLNVLLHIQRSYTRSLNNPTE